MNIQWVLADNLVLDPTADIISMKNGGAFWGSWRTWRAYNTDNVICHDTQKAQDLIAGGFQTACNLYIPNSTYLSLNSPNDVKIYQGDFMGHEVDNQDELVAMNLAASICDVVLLLGFDWTSQSEDLKNINYRGLVAQAIKSRPDVQWILVNHTQDIWEELSQLPNLDKDSLNNVLAILNG